MLAGLSGGSKPSSSDIIEYDKATIEEFYKSADGSALLRAEWTHKKSVSSAYWDPRGRAIVSTSYDDTIRRECSPWGLRAIVFTGTAVWDVHSSALGSDDKFASSRPLKQISHDCQTVRITEYIPNDDFHMQSPGQMVDDSQSTLDTKPRCLPVFHDRQYESFLEYVLCEGRPASNTLGQLEVDPVDYHVTGLLTH